MSSNVEYMQHAIRLAKKGLYTTDPNPCVGCVIVKAGEIVGEGWHQRAGDAHAEINALKQAAAKAKDATVFVTLEPCSHTGKTPPCVDALINAGVKKVFVAMIDPNPIVAGGGLKKLQDAGIETEYGLLESQARDLNPGFIKRMECGRPFVRVKLAMSLDGRTAMASGESQWISGEASRNDVQRLRAQCSAILTGIDTVLADNPSMNVRLTAQQLNVDPALARLLQPKLIVLDSRLRMPADVKIATLDNECTVYTTASNHKDRVDTECVDKGRQYPFTIETIEANDGQIDLHTLMTDLAIKEINLLHVEAGSVLSGALLENALVDEIVIYMAPHIMGDNAKGLFHLPELEKMKDRISLSIKDVRSIGDDIRIIVLPEYSLCQK